MRHAHRTALFHRNAKQARTAFGRRLGQAGLFAGVSLMALATLMQGSAPAWAQGEFAVDVTDPNVQVDLSVLNDGGIGPRMGAPVPAATSATAAPSTGQGGYRAPGPTPPVSTLYIQPSGDYALPPQTKPLIAEPKAAPELTPAQDEEPVQTASTPEPVDIPEPPAETLPAPEPVGLPHHVIRFASPSQPMYQQGDRSARLPVVRNLFMQCERVAIGQVDALDRRFESRARLGQIAANDRLQMSPRQGPVGSKGRNGLECVLTAMASGKDIVHGEDSSKLAVVFTKSQ